MKKKTLRKLAVALPLSVAAVIGVACAVQDYQGGAVFQPFASDRALQSNQVLFPDDGERTEQGMGDETDDSALWEKDREAEEASRPQQQDRADYLFQDNTPDTPSGTLAGTTTPQGTTSPGKVPGSILDIVGGGGSNADLIIGGTTPSPALLRQVKAATGLPVRALLRPRFGDFCYDSYELAQMAETAAALVQAGADGIVTGVLTPEGELDVDALRPIYAAARAAAKAAGRPVVCTLHRAFDVCKDPFAALEAAKALNLGTILTSGQAASAPAGASLLHRLVEAAGPDLEILVGAGVTPANLPALAAETGAHAFHMSGKQVLDSRMTFRREGVPMGLPGFSEFEVWQTSEETIRAARRVLNEL